jgi:hypothetical protein
MRANLERLLISESQLLELTGFDRQKILESIHLTSQQIIIHRSLALGITAIAFVTLASVFLPSLRITGIVFLISLTMGALSFAIEFAEVAVLCFCVALASAIYTLYILANATLSVVLLCLSLAIASGVVAFFLMAWIRKLWQKSKRANPKNQIPQVVIQLFAEVDKCNKAIRDIDIFDQLKDAGNPIKLASREAAIAALRMTRNDIIRALKTERILREHPEFHPDNFDIDLNAFQAVQMRDLAQEYAHVFDTTLQIAIDVQKAMAELQNQITETK